MQTVDQEVIIDIVNKTAQKQKVVLFDVVGAYNSQNAAAQDIKYQWDITSSLITAGIFNQSMLAVIAALNPNGSYQLFTYTNPGGTFTSAQEVVTGLNSFGIGKFTNVGNIITTFNANYLISSLNLCNLLIANSGVSGFSDVNGSLIYDAGYTTGLIGNLSRISTGNSFWINGASNTVDGPFNRSAIAGISQPAAFFGQIDSDVQKTVYIGVSFYRGLAVFFPPASLYLNNQLVWEIVNQSQANAVAANVNTILGTAFIDNDIMESLFHIVPVTLMKGRNIIQGDFQAIMGLEVYDNTPAEIAGATSYAELNLLYSSRDYIGQQLF